MNDQHMSLCKTPRTSEPYKNDSRSGKHRECREIFKQRRRVVEDMFERYGIFPPEAQVDNLIVSFIFKKQIVVNSQVVTLLTTYHFSNISQLISAPLLITILIFLLQRDHKPLFGSKSFLKDKIREYRQQYMHEKYNQPKTG